MDASPTHHEKTWGTACRLAGIDGYVIALRNVLEPVLPWLIKNEEYPLADAQRKELLDIPLTVATLGIVAGLLLYFFIGLHALWMIPIVELIFIASSAVGANEALPYCHPVSTAS